MSSERGFTLVEMLVALAILAAGFAALDQTLGVGLRAAATAERERRATAAAENLFAELGRSRPLQDGTSEGDLPDGQHWRLVIAPLSAASQDGPASLLTGHLVHLAISGPGQARGGALVVDTLLLGAAP